MESLPGYCSFKTVEDNLDFTIIVCHNRTWKNGAAEDADFLDDACDGVQKELGAEDNDIIVLGDFNIHGDYERKFGQLKKKGFKEAITFKTDTMLSKTNNSTLDNIFYLEGTDLGFKSSDAFEFDGKEGDDIFKNYPKEGNDFKKISDHYPVWATFDMLMDDD